MQTYLCFKNVFRVNGQTINAERWTVQIRWQWDPHHWSSNRECSTVISMTQTWENYQSVSGVAAEWWSCVMESSTLAPRTYRYAVTNAGTRHVQVCHHQCWHEAHTGVLSPILAPGMHRCAVTNAGTRHLEVCHYQHWHQAYRSVLARACSVCCDMLKKT